MEIKLEIALFDKDAIFKCLYWYSKDFNIDIKTEGDSYVISLVAKNDDVETLGLSDRVNQDLIDYNLRQIVKKETTTIRELIIAKAFSNGEFDEEPKGDLMDPLGIKFL